nr:nuclear fusion defective 6 [Fagopyrum tataricum]
MAAARSIFRSSSSVRNAASKFASGTKPSPSPFRLPTNKPLTSRLFRSPVELSACLDTMQPFHTVTASALMTSMLSISQRSYGWLAEDL